MTNGINKILVTGASSGVGKALTSHLAGKFHVIAAARRVERLNKYFGENPNVSVYHLDLSSKNQITEFIETVKADHGEITHLINNAGVLYNGTLTEIDTSDVEYSVQVNAMAPFMLIRGFLPKMQKSDFGRIINITSGAPLNCFPNFGAYSASKGMLNSLTVTLAKEYADSNIKINLMSPGPVQSEMSPDSGLQPEVCFPMVEYLLNLTENGPTGRFFWLKYEVPLFPDLEGVEWLEGKGNDKLREVLDL